MLTNLFFRYIFNTLNETVYILLRLGRLLMIMQQVRSSKIQSVGYNNSAMILRVTFFKDGVFEYYGVPERIVKEFLDSDSLGTYFKRFIKDRYRFVRLG